MENPMDELELNDGALAVGSEITNGSISVWALGGYADLDSDHAAKLIAHLKTVFGL
jgi:hypothetical protein